MKLSDYTKDSSDLVFGWLGYTNQAVTDRACLLRESENGLELVIPFKGQRDEIATWFIDPDQPIKLNETVRKALPSQIWVKDVISNKFFCLVNSRISHKSISLGTLQGYAVIVPDLVAVGTGGVDYSRVNRVRSYIPELTNWTGLSSLRAKLEPKDDMRGVKSFQADFVSAASKSIVSASNGISLALVPTDYSTTHHGVEPRVMLQASVSFESRSEAKVSLSEQMARHVDLTSLLAIIAWRNIGFKSISVYTEEDASVTFDGKVIGPYYRPAITKVYEPWVEPKKWKPYLIKFEDIGEAGLAKWFELMQDFRDPLEEISYIARLHDSLALQSQVLIYGTAFEELGMAIGKKAGERQLRGSAPSVKRVMKDCDFRLFSSEEAISSAVANTYNAVKHPDFKRDGLSRSDLLSMENLYNVATACRVLSLLWIGSKLGCSEGLVQVLKETSSIIGPISQWI